MPELRDLLTNLPPELQPPAPGSPPARILAATRQRLAESGPGGVSMRAVAAAAGVNQAMINYYFQSKDHLLDVLLGQEILQVMQDVIAGLGALPESAEIFVQHPLRILDALRTDPLRMRMLRLVLATEPERMRRVIRELGQHGILGAADALRGLAARARDAGGLPDVDPGSILLFLLANAYGLIFMAPVAREVMGFDLGDDAQWAAHRRNLELLLRRSLLADERTTP